MTGFTATFTLIAVALGAFVALLANRLSGARGWASEQSLSLVALTAVAYAILDLASSIPMPDRWTVLGQQLELTAAGLHVLAWLRHSRRNLEPGKRAEAAEWVVSAATLLTLVPGAVRTGSVVPREVPSLGLVYREAEAAPGGELFMAVLFVAMIALAWRYLRAWRRGTRGAGVITAGCLVLLACGVNDALSNLGLANAPLLLGLGFFVPIVAATWALAGRFVREMAELAALRAELERQVAERSRAIADLDASLRRDARLAALGRFTGAVAHAINNPAAVAAANVDHLLHRVHRGLPPAGDDGGEPLADARQALEQIGQVTRQLLFASRFAAEPWSEPVEVLGVVREAVAVARERGRLPAQVTVEVPPGLRTRAHGRGLAEVLANLLASAREAAPGPTVSVTVRARTLASGIELLVADDGPGPRAEAGALEPFFDTRPGGGGVVSLGICRALLRAQGGDLVLEATPGGGATVRLTLPDGAAEAAA